MSKLSENILRDVEIYAFSGKIGTGKNFLAEQVFHHMLYPKPTIFQCLADQLKINCITHLGTDRYNCWVKKDQKSRRDFQIEGTEKGRDVYGENYWNHILREWLIMHTLRGAKRFIITDVRFVSEFDFLVGLGATMFRVEAPLRNMEKLRQEAIDNEADLEKISNHRSEIDLDGETRFHHVIQNDPGDNAITQLRDITRSIHLSQSSKNVFFCDLDNTICECNKYYVEASEKAKKRLSGSLSGVAEDVFDTAYKTFTRKYNGVHATTPFFPQKFAGNLVNVAKEFRKHSYLKDYDFETMLKEIHAIGMRVFDHDYEPIPGRIEQVMELSKHGKVVIFTMGDRFEQVKKIAHLGLQKLDFEIFDFKDETTFRYLMQKYPAENHYMIGDSLDRDIIPALNVGVKKAFMVVDDRERYWNGEVGRLPEGCVVVKEIDEVGGFLELRKINLN